MPVYRLIFPPAPDEDPVNSPTHEIDSGDVIYKVGDVIEFRGRRWQVSAAPSDEPQPTQTADLMVWPAD